MDIVTSFQEALELNGKNVRTLEKSGSMCNINLSNPTGAQTLYQISVNLVEV